MPTEDNSDTNSPMTQVMEQELVGYIKRSSQLFLDFEDQNFDECLKQELTSRNVKKLLQGDKQTYLYMIKEKMTDKIHLLDKLDHNLQGQAVVYIKKDDIQAEEKNLKKKIRQNFHIMNIGEINQEFKPYSFARNCLKNAFNPMLKDVAAYTTEDVKNDKCILVQNHNDNAFIQNVQKQFDDIEIMFLSSSQSQEVPTVKIIYDEEIQKIFSKNPDSKIEDLPKEVIEDPQFVNRLINQASKWSKLSQILINHDRTSKYDSIKSEIEYWSNLKDSLIDLSQQLQQPGVLMSMNIIKIKKKNKIKMNVNLAESFNLSKKIQDVDSVHQIMKEIKIELAEQSQNLTELSAAMLEIFSSIKLIFNNMFYPNGKFKNILDNFSRLICDQLVRIFKNNDVMYRDIKEFEELINQLKKQIINVWHNQIQIIKNNFNNNNNNLSNQVFSYINKHPHLIFNDRAKFLFGFAENHHNMKRILKELKENADPNEMTNFINKEELSDKYEKFLNQCNIWDLSKDGEKKMNEAQKDYNDKIDMVEKEVIIKIRDVLGQTKNLKEMYRVFTRFQILMKRPQIRNAIKEYQDQLVKKLQEKSNSYYQKYKKGYRNSGASKIAEYYGILQKTGSYYWGEQINTHMNKCVEDIKLILDKDVKSNEVAKEVIKQQDNMKVQRKMDQEKQQIGEYKVQFEGNLLKLEQIHRNNTLKLSVNFSASHEEKVIDLRNYIKRINTQKSTLSHKYYFKRSAWPIYVNAQNLQETIKMWNQITPKIDREMTFLLAEKLKKVYVQIEKGFKYEWENREQVETEFKNYFYQFYEEVQDLENSTTYLYEKLGNIDSLIKSINNTKNQYEEIHNIIQQIQEIIDELLLKQYTNINKLVDNTNKKIEKVFVKKLTEVLVDFTDEFSRYSNHKKTRKKNKIIKQHTEHHILVKNKVIYIDPPIHEATQFWLDKLHSTINNFSSQKKLTVKSYQMNIADDKVQKIKNFNSIVKEIPVQILRKTYDNISTTINQINQYSNTWMSYQALWDIDVNMFYERFGDDLDTWQRVLNEIKQGRNTFDNAEYETNFGPVVINYKNVQLKVNNLYDNLHKSLLNEFALKFIDSSQKTLEEVKNQSDVLENINFNDVGNLVENISAINYCKQNMKKWQRNIKNFKDNEKLLQQQKYYFPEEYKDADTQNKSFKRFVQIFNYKNSSFEQNLDKIKNDLGKEEEKLLIKLNEIKQLWQEKKPFASDLNPNEAIKVLDTLGNIITENKSKLEKLNKAKELLKLPQIDLDIISMIIEDSKILRKLWEKAKIIIKPLDPIMEESFEVLQPVKFTKAMDSILNSISELPLDEKNHEIFIGKKKYISKLKKKFRMIRDFKSEAIKEHHFKQILQILDIKKNPDDLVIGDFFKVNLAANEKKINDIIAHATGELVLENMLAQIKGFWSEQEFQLSNYQDKVMLIKGWDEVMERAEEDLGQLNSMKLSKHYRTFEVDIKNWTNKLFKISNCLSTWMDVQRKWVYLEGIFLGSSDIKKQLRNEYDRFMKINLEFIQIMKKMQNNNKIVEVIQSIPNLQKTLEFLSETLDKIQKSLSEYLETQRQAFSRFYFVGDEDLLEIIGNSKEVINIQKYFSKMFAGINSVLINEKNTKEIKGMSSKENEQVEFTKVINISDYEKINQWLLKLEQQMQISLANQLEKGIESWKTIELDKMRQLVEKYPTQIVLVAFQTYWTWNIEDKMINGGSIEEIEQKIIKFLSHMAEEVLLKLPKLTRKRYQQLITEMVHKRDVSRFMASQKEIDIKDFRWQYNMRYNLNMEESKKQNRLNVKVGNSKFLYSYEYLGITDKLVQTPLTDKCYFTLTQALWLRMGGAPFGPAGTGKTESVKMLGGCLGRFVLVFNCDENFNFKAMGRIFIGLCQVGAWGCFDEFNRLEERILSAVSQQILSIQYGLRDDKEKIDLMNKNVFLNVNLGIFVTMNPGYAGRSNLPENLKQLFRQMAMIKPDSVLIAQVMLFSQGFKQAEELSGKVVALFELCKGQLSSQPHYDFGLRSLKSVLNSAGNLKRKILIENLVENPHTLKQEQKIILRSFCDTVVPKLISEDGPLLKSLIQGVFPESNIPPIEDKAIMEKLEEECDRRFLQLSNQKFVEKVLQLNQILKLSHGVMLVGPTGSAKSAAWNTLLTCLTKVDGIKGEKYIIDPKAVSKDELYGKLDNTTMEWTDGIFTHILRKICENQRGESSKRHWIVFDGDVDPEWAENLNSVLDDNKMLTLPNGERLSIPSNVKILFEVESLKYATLATVSRCGMVWFSEDILEDQHIYYHYLQRIKEDNYDLILKAQQQEIMKEQRELREKCVSFIEPLFFNDNEPSLVSQALEIAKDEKHVMIFSRIRVLEALFALVRKGVDNVVDKNDNSFGNYSKNEEVIQKYMINWTIFAFNWAFIGDLKLYERSEYFNKIQSEIVDLPEGVIWPETDSGTTLIDYQVQIEDGEYGLWRDKIPIMDIQPEQVTKASLIITTVDTMRHQEVLCSWLLEHRPFIICGPPGSGKTMTLMSTLNNLQDYEMIFVNFSSSTNPQLILKQFEHYCEYVKGANKVVLRPRQPNKWLVLFCDEINLPDEDKYGTQYIITFLRQLTEQHGFWRASDKQWVSLERIQFVGACNPPTDAGRHPLAQRFLRHTPLMLVDFPGYDSLTQIYGTFNRGMLKRTPSLKPYADSLTKAMVEYYTQSQRKFTSDQQPHYIYSPRELTRWKYAMNEAFDTVETLEHLVRLWAHEALRLFEDRLVTEEEKKWCQMKVDELSADCFPGINPDCLKRPIIYSTYITKSYQSVEREDLRAYVLEKLKAFNEEEYDVQLVVFDEVLEHIIKIDRVLRQPIGHMLLVGASGVGKTTLSRFVSWINGLKVFQIKAGRNYGLLNFDEDLRHVMKRAGCQMEKICFIFDESNVVSVAFLERMNALLASGEIPGLFEGEEFVSLINTYKEAQGGNKVNETEEEIYAHFTKNVQRNLHVVFTMNPANPEFQGRTASSPAIFNRCVIDWFGDWPQTALYQVAKELTENITDKNVEHDIIVDTIVKIHNSVCNLNQKLRSSAQKFNYMTPRDYIDFLRQYLKLYEIKQSDLNETQKHLKEGLNSLKETEESVNNLKKELAIFNKQLDEKNKAASEKLELILEKKKESKKKIESSQELQVKIEKKKEEISVQSASVEKELNEAGPSLRKAEKSVSNIKSSQLGEIRAYSKPPEKVRMTLEAVLFIMKGKKISWADIKKAMGKSDFIDKILKFNIDKVSNSVKQKVIKNYIDKEEWDIKAINKSSKAAGPLAQWLQSVIKYKEILNQVQPMRQLIASLNQESQELEDQMTELANTITDLQNKIVDYEKEYEDLISKTEELKIQKETVATKIEKAQSLLMGLNSEKIRWSESSKSFQKKFDTLTGDVLLSAAFLTYIGFFGQYYRSLLITNWKNFMKKAGILFNDHLSFVEFLSMPQERILWQSKGLPSDTLCMQNAIIMQKYNRYPLIIDPSGQAMDYIINLYNDEKRKLVRTSFIDEGFMKQLETCLRFGLPILIQDVEKIEPILNSVLNKEIMKQGGRILIRVGDQEIDFSHDFQLFMITRNSEAFFSPDLCSRVTFVNFTVTKSSLENQFVNLFLKNERPDVESKRIRILKLQGEFIVKLRQLEDDLLQEISNSQGSNILENDEMIQKLANIKKESSAIEKEMSQSETVLEEIKEVTEQYKYTSKISSEMYFMLQKTSNINLMYQFSLKFYMQIIQRILTKNEILQSIPPNNYEQRIQVINEQVYLKIQENTDFSIKEKDKLLFALRFSQVKIDNLNDEILTELFKMTFKPSKLIESTLPQSTLQGLLSQNQLIKLEDLTYFKGFENLKEHIRTNESLWADMVKNPELLKLPNLDFVDLDQLEVQPGTLNTQIRNKIIEILIFNIIKPSKSIQHYRELVDIVLGENFMNGNYFNLKKTIVDEGDNSSPILFCSAPGFDPSNKIYELAKECKVAYDDVALGSAEGFELAYKSIDRAASKGSWVILKNVHLAPSWLKELEQDLFKMKPHKNFRIFLLSEFTDKIPVTLLRQSIKFIFELPDGVKASVKRTYNTVYTSQRSDKHPPERCRLHFILSWIHAVIMERLRYTPTGWSKKYEFSEADQKCALDIIDEYIDLQNPRQNLPLDQIPFVALRSIITNNIYGGKIDNAFDLKILKSIVDQYLTEDAFDPNKTLIKDKFSNIKYPDSITHDNFKNWIINLKEIETPVWAGLPATADDLLIIQKLQSTLFNLSKIQDSNATEIKDLTLNKEDQGQDKGDIMKEIGERTQIFLDMLPENMEKLERNEELIQNPLFRFLDREIIVCSNLLKNVRNELMNVQQMISGEQLPQQDTKKLSQNIIKNIVPKFWKKYTIPNKVGFSRWIKDFKNRVIQLQPLNEINDWQRKGVNLGEFLFPKAFITATRQAVAHLKKVSMDELELRVAFTEDQEVDQDSFLVNNLWIEGVKWDKTGFSLSDEISYHLKNIKFTWKVIKAQDSKKLEENEIFVPLYLNSERQELILPIKFKIDPSKATEKQLYQRGIALIAWKN